MVSLFASDHKHLNGSSITFPLLDYLNEKILSCSFYLKDISCSLKCCRSPCCIRQNKHHRPDCLMAMFLLPGYLYGEGYYAIYEHNSSLTPDLNSLLHKLYFMFSVCIDFHKVRLMQFVFHHEQCYILHC